MKRLRINNHQRSAILWLHPTTQRPWRGKPDEPPAKTMDFLVRNRLVIRRSRATLPIMYTLTPKGADVREQINAHGFP